MPSRNGPTDCASRPPIEANSTIGTANKVMPRLAIEIAGVQVVEHQRPQGVERADHHEHRCAHRQRGEVGTDAQEIEGEPRWHLGIDVVSTTACAGDERVHRDSQDGDQQERCSDPEWADQHRRDGRADREAGHVGSQHAPEVLTEVVGIGEDHDPPRRRIRPVRHRRPSRTAMSTSTMNVVPNAMPSRPATLNTIPMTIINRAWPLSASGARVT